LPSDDSIGHHSFLLDNLSACSAVNFPFTAPLILYFQ
jgi:hypothetical protein